MFSFSLKKNLAFKWNGAAYRIDRLQPNNDLVIEQMDTAQFVIVGRDKLLSEFVEGKISVEPPKANVEGSVPVYSRPLADLPDEIRVEVARRLRYVETILGRLEPHIADSWIAIAIGEVASELKDSRAPSRTTVYRWCRRYLVHRDARALIPRLDRRGRRSTLNDKALELLIEATHEAFAVSPQATCVTIYSRFIAKLDEVNRRGPAAPPIKRPSLSTIYRQLSRFDEYDKLYLKEGKRLANARFRLVKGSVQTENILERVEIDHTPLDLFLIDERSWIPLGRPTLTVVIDHFSRMLLGYYLSFGHPSLAAVMGALRHAILPKKSAVTAIPTLVLQYSWPCYGLFDAAVLDNGLEFLSIPLENVALDLGFRLQFCPKKEPRFKGVVERYLKTINYSFASQLPGTSFSRLHLRKDYDPQKHALLTLGEFTQIFEKWVLDVYAQSIHRGIGTTPWAKWHEGVARRPLSLPASVDALQRRIGIDVERSLRHDGIWIKGVQYCSDVLDPILTAYGSGVRVRAMFDPQDLGSIQVWGPDDQEPVCVPAKNQRYAAGLTLSQHKIIQAHLLAEGRDAQDLAQLELAKNEIAQTVENLMQSRKQSTRRKAALIRGITSDRPDKQIASTVRPLPARPKRSTSQDSITERMPAPSYSAFQIKR